MKKTMTILLLLGLCAALCSCSVNMYSYSDSRRYTAGGTTVTGRVEALDVSWVDGGVTIGYHDGQGVILTEDCRRSLDADDELHWWLDGGTLRVKYASSGFRMGVNLDKELTVLLPAGMTLDSLKVDVVSADVTAEGISANTIRVNSVSGNVELNVDDAVEVKADTVSGNLLLRFSRLPKELKADTVSGDVTIVMPADADATVEFDTVSGSVGGSMPMEKDGRRYVCGSGQCRISINTVSGDMQLDAAK